MKTADVIHQRILDRQAAQWGPYGPPPAPGVQPEARAGSSPISVIDQLERLGHLRASGVLTDAEFEAQKARILAG